MRSYPMIKELTWVMIISIMSTQCFCITETEAVILTVAGKKSRMLQTSSASTIQNSPSDSTSVAATDNEVIGLSGKKYFLSNNPPAGTSNAANAVKNLPSGQVGVSYSSHLDSTGQFSYTTLTSVPSGLQLSGSTLNGIPSTAGQFSFSANAIDQNSQISSSVTFNINIKNIELTTGDLPQVNVSSYF
jgi:hypothetical protein